MRSLGGRFARSRSVDATASRCNDDSVIIDEGIAIEGPLGARVAVRTMGPVVLLLTQAGFQACLAVGLPWGRAAYGGQNCGTLPARYRWISAGAAVAYAATALALTRGGAQRQRVLLSGVAALMASGGLLNAISRSPLERGLWTPYCALTAVLAWRARRLAS